MGINRFFWPQELLNQWMLDEKITLEGTRLKIESENTEYSVTQAIYFQADVGDGKDAHNLVGRVKELAILEKMGGEHYMDSVIIEDSAYKVVPGFTGTPVAKNQVTAKESRGKDLGASLSPAANDADAEDERELLARFLIENL